MQEVQSHNDLNSYLFILEIRHSVNWVEIKVVALRIVLDSRIITT